MQCSNKRDSSYDLIGGLKFKRKWRELKRPENFDNSYKLREGIETGHRQQKALEEAPCGSRAFWTNTEALLCTLFIYYKSDCESTLGEQMGEGWVFFNMHLDTDTQTPLHSRDDIGSCVRHLHFSDEGF